MSTAGHPLRAAAIVLNLMAAAWWIWTAVRVTSIVGVTALASSGGLLWIAFAVPPIVAVVALARFDKGNSN